MFLLNELVNLRENTEIVSLLENWESVFIELNNLKQKSINFWLYKFENLQSKTVTFWLYKPVRVSDFIKLKYFQNKLRISGFRNTDLQEKTKQLWLYIVKKLWEFFMKCDVCKGNKMERSLKIVNLQQETHNCVTETW